MVFFEGGWVDTVKVAVICPWTTDTLEGTVARLELLDNVTDVPPAGAGLSRVTVPVEEEPPCTVVGFKVSDES